MANRVAGDLMAQGNIVFSPISHSHPIACEYGLPRGWEFWKKFDECFIEFCDEFCIVCIDGWKESKGVKAEVGLAKKFKKPIKFI